MLFASSVPSAGCLQTAPTGPGDTPTLNVSSPGGPASVQSTGITGASARGGSQAIPRDAGVGAATNAAGGTGAGFTGAGGTEFSGPQLVGAGFTGTGGTGFINLLGSSNAQPGVNQAPLASFSIEPACLPEQDTAVTLVSTSIDPDGDPLLCTWSLPTVNVTSDNGCTVRGIAFLNADGVPIELSVSDNRGGTAIARALLVRCIE